VVDFRFRVEGRFVPTADVGPRYLRVPTLADAYDRAMGNQPLAAEVGRDEWHLTMLGKGTRFPGGDRDLVALWDEDTQGGWNLSGPEASAHAFPPYLDELPGLQREVGELDVSDGVRDGRWLGQAPLDSPDDILMSPAYADYQTATLEELISREGFGDDGVPDLLFTNYKQVDRVGHVWGIESSQMGAVVRSSDRALGDLIDVLDRQVGEGRWVIALTADHGVTPPPAETGAFRIDHVRLAEDIERRFDGDGDGRDVVEAPRFTQFWIDQAELRENGHTLKDVARYLLGYTRSENAQDPSKVPEDRRDDPLFAAAFPGSMLQGDLPCTSVP
jgi:hypothetical protein